MPLRILFADDSVTAQNMGKKILTEAGYDVVAVSNGAAAVKKIAEQKPDIIILDLYMPGYSGLEVCEKVRASMATVRTPVLLTVGKMEPYKPEDANRVRADGVIIKPFEASDLLAIMKKFEERISQMPAPPPPPPAAPPPEEISVTPADQHIEHHEPVMPAGFQPMVEVPDHMATTSAFSDLLGSDAAHAMDPYNVATPKRVPEAQGTQGAAVAAAAMPDYGVPASWRQEPEPVAAVAAPAPAVAAPVPEVAISAAPAPPEPPPTVAMEPQEIAAPPRPRLIPVFQEAEQTLHEFIPTAVPPLGDIDLPREPELQESAEETTRNTVADAREPGLMPTLHQAEEHAAQPGTTSKFAPVTHAEPPAEIQVATPPEAVAKEEPAVEPEHPAPEAGADTDFEARVAAAMAAYSHVPTSVTATEPPPVEETSAQEDLGEPLQAAAVEVPPPASHYQPPVTAAENHRGVAVAEPVTAGTTAVEPVAEAAPSTSVEATHVPVVEATTTHEEIAARIENELPATAAAAASAATEAGGDHHTIAQAVHRVMERVKGEMVEEILRELKSKK